MFLHTIPETSSSAFGNPEIDTDTRVVFSAVTSWIDKYLHLYSGCRVDL